MEKIIFQSDDGTAAEFYVEEQTNIAGVTYLLVSDSQDEEADAYILKDISAPGSTEACYEMVEDDLRLLFFRPEGLPLFLAGLCVFLKLFFTVPVAAVFFTAGRKGLS